MCSKVERWTIVVKKKVVFFLWLLYDDAEWMRVWMNARHGIIDSYNVKAYVFSYVFVQYISSLFKTPCSCSLCYCLVCFCCLYVIFLCTAKLVASIFPWALFPVTHVGVAGYRSPYLSQAPLHMVEMFWVSCNPRPSVLCVISVVLTSGRSWSLCAAGAGITWAKARCPQVSLPRQRSGCRPLRVPFSTALVYRSLCTVIPV